MAAKFATLDALEAELEAMGQLSADYWDKQVHRIPEAPSVDRVSWLLSRLTGKTVLHVGCAGPLHVGLHRVCKRVYGLDQAPARYPDDVVMDIEAEELPRYGDVEVVLLAEIVEHVCSMGVLLWQVQTQYPSCEVIITTPNAYSSVGYAWVQKGMENCNRDHTSLYSWKTLHTVLEKCHYHVQEFYWYNGKPRFAEGMIAVASLHA